MTFPNAARLLHCGDGGGTRAPDAIADHVGALAIQSARDEQVRPIRAELKDTTCTALGITAKSRAPVLALCRALVTAGHNPSLPLEAFRGQTLCLAVRSIGEGARLTVEDDRHGIPRFRKRGLPGDREGLDVRVLGQLAPRAVPVIGNAEPDPTLPCHHASRGKPNA